MSYIFHIVSLCYEIWLCLLSAHYKITIVMSFEFVRYCRALMTTLFSLLTSECSVDTRSFLVALRFQKHSLIVEFFVTPDV